MIANPAISTRVLAMSTIPSACDIIFLIRWGLQVQVKPRDGDILDAVHIIGFFNYYTRLADALGIDPEPDMPPP